MTTLPQPRDIVDAFCVAFNAKDAEALGSLFAEDAEFVNVRGLRMHRRDGIIDGHERSFSGPLVGSYIRFDTPDELRVTDDVTILHARCTRDRSQDAPPDTAPAATTMLMFVMRRSPDGWQAIAAANVPELPPA